MSLQKQLSNYLWVEKYRPTTVKLDSPDGIPILLPEKFRNYFLKMLKDGEIQNMLLVSSTPGAGKTSLAKALCNDIGCTYKYINLSSSTGIDVLRNDIQKFAAMKSLDGKPKIVIGDELDGSSPNFMQGLRAFCEEFQRSCRFIFTANYASKIIEPIKSRCAMFDFDMSEKKVVAEMKPLVEERLTMILEAEEIEYKPEIITKLVDTYYPDIRQMISLCQKYSGMHKAITNDIFNIEQIGEEFFTYIVEKKFRKAREYLIQHNYNYNDLYKELYDNLIPRIDVSKQMQIIVLISEYMYRHAFAIDPEINAAACLGEIMSTI